MQEIFVLIRLKFQQWQQAQIRRFKSYLWHNKFKLVFLVFLLYTTFQYRLSFEVPMPTIQLKERNEQTEKLGMSSVIADILGSIEKVESKAAPIVQAKKVNNASLGKPDEGNTYSNVSFWSGKKNLSKDRRERQQDYINRFAKIAQTEMRKFGIPASIILAQGILESNAGSSRLAMNNNNHFGVKCFSKNCQKGHCSNFTDDSHKDFFRIYQSPWESYRAHSIMIKTKHYRVLLRYGTKNYRQWAIGLKKLGYATDKHYAESLINTIEDLDLHRFDQ
jgi:flagellum-specific peptidoglycan hydrolase FlgJ